MNRICRIRMLHEKVHSNPVQHVETCTRTDYRAIVVTPVQTFGILKSLTNILHNALVLTCAATALRASEILALRWSAILWGEARIRVSKRWANGRDGNTKTTTSDGYVPLHPILAEHLHNWHARTPYATGNDFAFPSLKSKGRVPLRASVFVADYLRPAAIKAGVQIKSGQRFGLHNLRHSLSNWLVNKAKVDPKRCRAYCVMQGSKQLWIFTRRMIDSEEMREAQGQFLSAMGLESRTIQ